MPKGRMLNKKISRDEQVAKLSIYAAFLFTWMIPHSDSEGRMYAVPETIKGNVCPFLPYFTLKKIKLCLEELQANKLILIYGGGKYLSFNGFSKNQRIDKTKEAPSDIPTPEELQSNSGVVSHKGEVEVEVEVKGKGTPLASSDQKQSDKAATSPIILAMTQQEKDKANQILETLLKCSVFSIDVRSKPYDKVALAKIVQAYPNTDICKEILKAEAWLVTNKRHKTNYIRFLNNWLARADKG